MPSVRALNSAGVSRFREFLRLIRRGDVASTIPGFAFDDSLAVPLSGGVRVEPQRFATKLEMAAYLFDALRPLQRPELMSDVGLWGWIALFYFDQLAPVQESGTRMSREDYHYIPDLQGRYAYRHLVAGPYKLYALHGESARLFLYPEVHQHGSFVWQITWRGEMIANRGLVEAMDSLYFDAERKRPKRGASSADNPGNVRRLMTVLRQLEFNFDLQGMNAGEILALLPAEFDRWKR